MREIKFRAWDGNSIMKELPAYLTPHDINETITSMVSEGIILMQFTGLKDKNGKEIYEGDVVSSETYEINKQVVKWFYTYWQPFEYYMSQIEEDFEVIGNIYENPDLLNENTIS